MLWPSGDMGEAWRVQHPRNGVFAYRNTKPPLHYANQIPAAPAHNPIPRQVRPFLHDVFQCCLLLHRELAWPPRRDVIDQPKLLGTHPLFERNRHHAPRPRISRIMGDGITAEDPEESTPPDSKRRRLRVSLFAGWYYTVQH